MAADKICGIGRKDGKPKRNGKKKIKEEDKLGIMLMSRFAVRICNSFSETDLQD